jgi:GNAT superfamily N-acetyltransferase
MTEPSFTVVELSVDDVYGMRRSVLRDGKPDADVSFANDARPGAFHLGARDEDGRIVGIASFAESPTSWREGQRAAQLRGMATEPSWQGTGVGRAVLEAGIERLRATGYEVLWANARDSALGFYTRLGMAVVGDGFIVADMGLPHHVVILDL